MVTLFPREEWQCQYRGGPCGAARAVKDDGSLHHLCSEHRQRANLNQRRSQDRRRRMRIRLLEAAVAAAAIAPNARCNPTKRRNSAAAAAGEWRVLASEVRRPVDTQSDDLGGMPLMSDSELFAPIMAESANDLPPFDNGADLDDELVHFIELLDGGFTPTQ
jgi:hypothetical protein